MPDTPSEAPQRRLIAPKYPYDPDGVYEDPNVQAWAQYYAYGGTDLAGASYFISIPGLTDQQNVLSAEPNLSSNDDACDADSSVPVPPPHDHPSVASESQSHREPPRGPRRKTSKRNDKAKRGVLGLLEFLHITKRPRTSSSINSPPSASSPPHVSSTEEATSEPTETQDPTISMEADDNDSSDRYKAKWERERARRYGAEESTQVPETEGRILPPSYAESVYTPSPAPQNAATYSSEKASFAPSVSFGENTEGDFPRPLPFPAVRPEFHPTDEKVPAYEEFTVGQTEVQISDEVPARLSQIEVTLSPGRGAQSASKPLYHNLMSLLLMEVSPVNNTTTNSVIETLNEYAESLRSFDPVTSLVRSHIYRGSLLQVASVLRLSDDPRVRRALQADETDIAEILHHVSLSDADREAVIALEGDEAQSFLNVVQDVLDRGFLFRDPAETTQARRLLVKLSANCYKLPSKLFIEGVTRCDEHATFGGGFGDVFRGTYNGAVVALKRMRIFQRDADLPQKRRKFCQEALTWQSLKHAYIVPFLGIVGEEFPTVLCMVSPWMRHGTVLKHLADNGRACVNKRLYEISQGLEYLHSQHIVHGDLRGSNILINDSWQACLTDFGLTVFNDATPATYTSRHEGSVRWMAPELFMPQKFGMERFRLTPASDIYAFGCVCLELYTGRVPFHDIFHDPAIILKVTDGQRPDRPTYTDPILSDDLWRLVQACWSQRFLDRPSTKDVVSVLKELSHPPLQALPILEVPIPSPSVVEFDGDVPKFDDLMETEEESTSTTKAGKKRVHFDLPDSAGPTSSSIDLSAIGQQRTRYDEAVAARETRAAQDSFDLTLPLVHAFQGQDEDWDDNNSSSSGSYVHSTEDEEEDVDSSASSFFDPDLLVSPRKPKTFSFPVYHASMALTDTPCTDEVDTVVGENQFEDTDEDEVQVCSLSAISAFIEENVPRETRLWKGELYPESFTNNDLVSTIEARLRGLHDPSNAPLPFATLASDIAWSLRLQGFCESVDLAERSENNVYFSENDNPPTGIIPMLTRCYSFACSDLYPCYTYTCPRWGQAESKSRPMYFHNPLPLRITNLDDDDLGSARIQVKLPSTPPPRSSVDVEVEEGDILDRYWELIDEMDGAFDPGFHVGGFSEEVARKVESIIHPGRAEADQRWLLLWTLFSFVSLWFLHTLYIVPFTFL